MSSEESADNLSLSVVGIRVVINNYNRTISKYFILNFHFLTFLRQLFQIDEIVDGVQDFVSIHLLHRLFKLWYQVELENFVLSWQVEYAM